ncbi:MAG: YHS domain-containing protein [Bacteroidetes bacterium]|nr:YHS domain-containing protein [Bacteroidota bacterium]
MKKIIGIILIAAAISCNNQSKTEPAAADKKMDNMPSKTDTTNKFAGLTFDSPKDLSCGMPVTAGVEDTAHYKGKVYGFCSAECKADFMKDPEAHLAAK